MPDSMFWLFLTFFLLSEGLALNFGKDKTESWTGKWFPAEPTSYRPDIAKDHNGRIPMGSVNPNCDDAKTNLTVDWNDSFEDYTCTSPRTRFVPNKNTDSLTEFENIPKAYLAPHFCMEHEIKYTHKLPTFGPHRPLWPIFGEYKFLPKQRWIHSLEHGGIVALYHPCADLRQIELLKKLVKGCLRRHVITPSRDLSEERPFGLLAWGVRYTTSTVYPNAIRQFIKERALKGPEETAKDGQYNHFLIEPAFIVSDYEDSKLCPDQ